MIALLTTWVTERIVTVITVTLLAVAAVPTTLVLVSQRQAIASQEHQQLVLLQTVKDEGDRVIARIRGAEASCDSQITQIVTTAHANSVPKVQTAVARGTAQVHMSVVPFIVAIQKEEDEFAKLAFVTSEIEHVFLNNIHTIQVVALGERQTVGVVTTTCQTVVIQIRFIIEVIVIHHHEDDDD